MANEQEGTGGIAKVMALAAREGTLEANTVMDYESLIQRLSFLSSRIQDMEVRHALGSTKSMRVRVNASRTAKGYSVDATCEVTNDDYMGDVGQHLQDIALKRLELLMAELNEQYPREAP